MFKFQLNFHSFCASSPNHDKNYLGCLLSHEKFIITVLIKYIAKLEICEFTVVKILYTLFQ